jgi:glycosyltransferase involved in cell wall biosynthesis
MSKSGLRRILRQTLIHFASAIIAYGTKAAEYIKILDKKKQIFIAYNTTYSVELPNRETQSKSLNLESHEKFRSSHQENNILFVGRLVKLKGIKLLLQALHKLLSDNFSFILHIVGEGPEKSHLISLAHKNKLSERAVFWGHKDKNDLAAFYSFSNIFIFPTLGDIWGLVLNEALSAGVPVIASKYAGATYDLVLDGINGFIVDPHDIQEMANKIRILIENSRLREEMARNAQKIMQEKFTIEQSAQRFVDAIKYSLRY